VRDEEEDCEAGGWEQAGHDAAMPVGCTGSERRPRGGEGPLRSGIAAATLAAGDGERSGAGSTLSGRCTCYLCMYRVGVGPNVLTHVHC